MGMGIDNDKKAVLSQGPARCRYNFPRWQPAATFDLIELEIAPLESANPENPRTKHEVDRITLFGDMATRNSTYQEGCI